MVTTRGNFCALDSNLVDYIFLAAAQCTEVYSMFTAATQCTEVYSPWT